jgi:hypothetical protein
MCRICLRANAVHILDQVLNYFLTVAASIAAACCNAPPNKTAPKRNFKKGFRKWKFPSLP